MLQPMLASLLYDISIGIQPLLGEIEIAQRHLNNDAKRPGARPRKLAKRAMRSARLALSEAWLTFRHVTNNQ